MNILQRRANFFALSHLKQSQRSLKSDLNMLCYSCQFFKTLNVEKKFYPQGIGFKKEKERENKRKQDANPMTPFRQQDYDEMIGIQKRYTWDRRYMKIMNDWQVNLRKKTERRERSRELLENYKFPEAQGEKLVVHDVQKEIELPAKDENLFAIIEFKGLQHKVLRNDTVMLEKIPLEVGQTFVFDKVLMIGTTNYTSLGRPYVESAKVLACVEQQALSDKVIIFKKRRRKGYQKNMGHRQEITIIKILKVLHNPSEEVLSNYATL